MKLSKVAKMAEKYGMEPCGYDFLDGYLTGVSFRDKTTKKGTLLVEAEFTNDYEEELKQLEPNTEYELDFDKCIVYNACVYGPFVNESGFFDGSENGILLYGRAEKPDRYYHSINLLEKCIKIQQNPITHSRFIMEQHIKHIDYINKNFKPILDEFGFREELNSFFRIEEEREDTNIQIWYTFDKLNSICLYTDCVEGKLIYSDRDVTNATPEEFKKLLMDEVVFRGGSTPTLDFEFVFHKGEKGWDKTTAQQICQIDDDLHHRGYRYDGEVDYDSVPEKYAALINEHKQLPIRTMTKEQEYDRRTN